MCMLYNFAVIHTPPLPPKKNLLKEQNFINRKIFLIFPIYRKDQSPKTTWERIYFCTIHCICLVYSTGLLATRSLQQCLPSEVLFLRHCPRSCRMSCFLERQHYSTCPHPHPPTGWCPGSFRPHHCPSLLAQIWKLEESRQELVRLTCSEKKPVSRDITGMGKTRTMLSTFQPLFFSWKGTDKV